MKIRIERIEKVALLNALQTGVLDTDSVPALKKILNETRPDIVVSEMSDAELDQRISELEQKLRINR